MIHKSIWHIRRESLRNSGKLQNINPRTNNTFENDLDYYLTSFHSKLDTEIDNGFINTCLLSSRISSKKDLLRIENNLVNLKNKKLKAYEEYVNFVKINGPTIITFDDFNENSPFLTKRSRENKKPCYFCSIKEGVFLQSTYEDKNLIYNFSSDFLDLYDLYQSYRGRYCYLFNLFKILVENFIEKELINRNFPDRFNLKLKNDSFNYHDFIGVVLNKRKYIIEIVINILPKYTIMTTNWPDENQKLPLININENNIVFTSLK